MRVASSTASVRVKAPSSSKCLAPPYNLCVSKNGDVYKGMWKNHVKDGVGIYKYAATGKEEILVYEEGKLIKQV